MLQLSAHPENQTLSFVGLSNYRLFGTIKRPMETVIRAPVAPRAPASPKVQPVSPQKKGLHQLDLGDPKMQKAIKQALSVVNSDIPLVIQGETGVGKEVFAKAVHTSSDRRVPNLWR